MAAFCKKRMLAVLFLLLNFRVNKSIISGECLLPMEAQDHSDQLYRDPESSGHNATSPPKATDSFQYRAKIYLKFYCPEIYKEGNGKVCCPESLINHLDEYFAMVHKTTTWAMQGRRLLYRLMCNAACRPDQASFATVVSDAIRVPVSVEEADSLFNATCQVQNPLCYRFNNTPLTECKAMCYLSRREISSGNDEDYCENLTTERYLEVLSFKQPNSKVNISINFVLTNTTSTSLLGMEGFNETTLSASDRCSSNSNTLGKCKLKQMVETKNDAVEFDSLPIIEIAVHIVLWVVLLPLTLFLPARFRCVFKWILPFILSGIAFYFIVFFKVETKMSTVEQIIPQSSEAYKAKVKYEQVAGKAPRIVHVLFTDESTNPNKSERLFAFLQQLHFYQTKITQLKTVNREHGHTVHLTNVCFKLTNSKCYMDSPLNFFQNNMTELALYHQRNQLLTKLDDCYFHADTMDCASENGDVTFSWHVFGKDRSRNMLLRFELLNTDDAIEWENELKELILNQLNQTNGIQIQFRTKSSEDEAIDHSLITDVSLAVWLLGIAIPLFAEILIFGIIASICYYRQAPRENKIINCRLLGFCTVTWVLPHVFIAIFIQSLSTDYPTRLFTMLYCVILIDVQLSDLAFEAWRVGAFFKYHQSESPNAGNSAESNRRTANSSRPSKFSVKQLLKEHHLAQIFHATFVVCIPLLAVHIKMGDILAIKVFTRDAFVLFYLLGIHAAINHLLLTIILYPAGYHTNWRLDVSCQTNSNNKKSWRKAFLAVLTFLLTVAAFVIAWTFLPLPSHYSGVNVSALATITEKEYKHTFDYQTSLALSYPLLAGSRFFYAVTLQSKDGTNVFQNISLTNYISDLCNLPCQCKDDSLTNRLQTMSSCAETSSVAIAPSYHPINNVIINYSDGCLVTNDSNADPCTLEEKNCISCIERFGSDRYPSNVEGHKLLKNILGKVSSKNGYPPIAPTSFHLLYNETVNSQVLKFSGYQIYTDDADRERVAAKRILSLRKQLDSTKSYVVALEGYSVNGIFYDSGRNCIHVVIDLICYLISWFFICLFTGSFFIPGFNKRNAILSTISMVITLTLTIVSFSGVLGTANGVSLAICLTMASLFARKAAMIAFEWSRDVKPQTWTSSISAVSQIYIWPFSMVLILGMVVFNYLPNYTDTLIRLSTRLTLIYGHVLCNFAAVILMAALCWALHHFSHLFGRKRLK